MKMGGAVRKKKLEFRLQTKVAVIVGMTLVLALGSAVFIVVRTSTADLREALQGKTLVLGQEMARGIEKVIGIGADLEDLEDLSKRCAELADSHGLAFVLVADREGKIHFHSDENEEGKTMPAAFLPEDAQARDFTQYAAVSGGRKSYNTFIPVRDGAGSRQAAVVLGLPGEVLAAKVSSQIRNSILIGVVSFSVSLVLIIYFFRSQIGRPLSGLISSSRAVAQGDLTQQIGITSLDEIGELSQAFGDMLGSLRDLQGRVAGSFQEMEEAVGRLTENTMSLQAGTEKQSQAVAQITTFIQHMGQQNSTVTDSMNDLTQVSLETSSSITEMMKSIDEVATSTEFLSRAIDETSTSMQDVLLSNREVATNIESLTDLIYQVADDVKGIGASSKQIEGLAQESRNSVEEVKVNAERDGTTAVKATIVLMARIREAIMSLSETTGTLAREVGNIGAILNVIDDVTDQTNLLSLNAAIIAAAAGQHGQGFAVVADEIRKLAESTSASTREITKVISGIQSETQAVEDLVKKSVDYVDEGQGIVGQADEALQKIIESAEKAVAMSSRIAEFTAAQTAGSLNVAGSIQNVFERASQISTSISSQSRESDTIINAIEKVRALSDKVRGETVEQAQGARLISEAGQSVTHMAQKLSKSVEQSSRLSDEASGEANAILDSTLQSSEIVDQLNGMVTKFVTLSANLKSTLGNFKT